MISGLPLEGKGDRIAVDEVLALPQGELSAKPTERGCPPIRPPCRVRARHFTTFPLLCKGDKMISFPHADFLSHIIMSVCVIRKVLQKRGVVSPPYLGKGDVGGVDRGSDTWRALQHPFT